MRAQKLKITDLEKAWLGTQLSRVRPYDEGNIWPRPLLMLYVLHNAGVPDAGY